MSSLFLCFSLRDKSLFRIFIGRDLVNTNGILTLIFMIPLFYTLREAESSFFFMELKIVVTRLLSTSYASRSGPPP